MKTSEFQQLAVGDLVQVKPTGSGARFFGSRVILVGEVLALSAIPETRINSRPLVGRKSVLLPDGKEVFGALAIDAPTGTHVVIGIIKKIGWRSQDNTWQDPYSWESTPRTYSYRQVITRWDEQTEKDVLAQRAELLDQIARSDAEREQALASRETRRVAARQRIEELTGERTTHTHEITDEMLHLVEAAYQRGLRDGKNSGDPA